MGAKGTFTKEHLLQPADIVALKAAAEKPIEKLVVFTLLYTGMRVGEFVHLRQSWVVDEEIRVPSTQQCTCPECLKERNGVWSPKSAMGARSIPMLPDKFPLLTQVLNWYFTKVGPQIISVVPNRATAWHHLNNIGKRVKFKQKLFPHALRGTYAYQLAKADISALEMCQIMGWTDIKIAQQYVMWASQDLKRDMNAKLPRW